MLTVEGIEVWRGRTLVLQDMSFELPAGRVTALLGGNGSGKSTTLFAISGLVPVKAGAVRKRSVDITNAGPVNALRAGIAQVPQGREVFATLTVRENLEAGCALVRGRREREERIAEVLERFPAMATRLRRPAGTLSGGEQQQLSIARALLTRPEILLMDEPSAGLSPVVVDTLIDTILNLKGAGYTILLVEQNVGVAAAAADDALVLKAGAIAMRRPAKELFQDRELLAAYLGR